MRYRFLRFPEGKLKAVTFSYDDGCRADIQLAEIFNKYGIKGTFNINYGQMDIDQTGLAHPRLRKDQVKDLYQGHEIATHTMTHPTIARCPLVGAAEEILEAGAEYEDVVALGGLIN